MTRGEDTGWLRQDIGRLVQARLVRHPTPTSRLKDEVAEAAGLTRDQLNKRLSGEVDFRLTEILLIARHLGGDGGYVTTLISFLPLIEKDHDHV